MSSASPPAPAPIDEAAADRRRARREALLVALVGLLMVGAGVFGLWLAAAASIRVNFQQYMLGLVKTASVQVDRRLHDSLRDPSQLNSPEYLRAVEPLRRMRSVLPDVHYIYTAVRDGDGIRFVLDAVDGPGDRDGDGVEDQVGVWEYYAVTPDSLEAFGDGTRPGKAVAGVVPYTDKWGSFVTAWAPMLDEHGEQFGAVGLDIDASVYLDRLAAARRWAVLGLLPAGLLIAAFAFSFHRMRLRALQAIREAARAARVLAREQERLQSVIEGTAVGTWEVRLDTAQITVDARWAEMIGRTPEQLGQLDRRGFFELLHPDDREQAAAAVDATLRDPDRLLEIDLRMRHADGHWVWISVRAKVIGPGPEGGPQRMVGTHVDISARKAMELELAEAACVDKLTGLANRARFMEQLEVAVERVRTGQQARFAVLFLDFDRFKLVNDSMGHAAGDELLRGIAARLRGMLRSAGRGEDAPGSNLIARFGGDEFLVLVNELDADAEAEAVATRLLGVLAAPYRIQGREVRSTASIGVITSGQCLESAEAIVRGADIAMYEAKRSGRATAVRFTESLGAQATKQATAEAVETGVYRVLEDPGGSEAAG